MAGHEIDDRPGSRAELLCFLVATAAASRSLTHEWRVDHVVESCRIWLARHAVVMHWLERVKIGQLALRVARRDLRGAGITGAAIGCPSPFYRRDGFEPCEHRGSENDDAVRCFDSSRIKERVGSVVAHESDPAAVSTNNSARPSLKPLALTQRPIFIERAQV